MNDTQFDDLFHDKLKDHAAPVPAGLWDKVVEGQFDQTIGGKLKDAEAPVPDGMWDKISDAQFDQFIGSSVGDTAAPVPADMWDRVSDRQFDSFVADKFRYHEAPVPEGLWEKIKPEEDDDRVGFFWFRYPAAAVLIIGLLTAAVWGGIRYFSSKNKIEDTVQGRTKFSSKDGAVTPVNPSAQDQQQTTPVTGNEPSVNPAQQTNPVQPDNTQQATNQPQDQRNNNNDTNNGNTDVPSNTGGHHWLSSSDKNKDQFSLVRPLTNKTDVTTNTIDPFVKNSDETNKQEAGISAKDDDELQYTSRGLLSGSTIPSGFRLQGSMIDKQLSTLNHTNQFHNVIICPGDKGMNKDWYLEAYVSPELVFKSVSNNSASAQYLARKDSSESMRVSYSAGIRLVKPITDNILLKAGIQYTQANEQYVYRVENEVKTTTVVSERTIIRGPGDTVIVKDTSVLQTAGYRNNTVKNHYRSLDIPVSVGYQFGDDDLKIGINAGVVFNVSSWYDGVMLDSSLATVTLPKNGNPVYKTNIGLGLIGGISITKRLSDDLHVFVEPHFRYNLTNMTTPQAAYNQRFSLGGLSVGLRLNLNRK